MDWIECKRESLVKIYIFGREWRFWSVQCLRCPESIVSRIDGGQGRKVPPSFFCPPFYFLFFHFSDFLNIFSSSTEDDSLYWSGVAEKLIHLVPQCEGLSGLCGCLIVSCSRVIQSHLPRYSHQIKQDLTHVE